MHPVGKCKLTCTRGNSKHLIQIHVVDCNVNYKDAMAKDTYEGWTMSKIQLHHSSLSSGNMFTSFCYVIISTGYVFVSLGYRFKSSDYNIIYFTLLIIAQ